MKKAKRSPFMRIAGVMLGASLLMTCVISGTLAKYTSSSNGSATATVAKWSVEVNSTDIAKNDTVTFNLFDTVKEADTNTTEENVSAGKIAPGTGGSFELKIDNKSEVDAKYSIALTETNESSIPIQYSTDKTDWADSLDAINTAQTNVDIAKESGTKTVTVYWRWVFDGSTSGAHANQTDVTDTGLGTADTRPTVQIAASFTATQVD